VINDTRPLFLATVQERLDAFQLELLSIGVPDPQTRRDSLEREFLAAVSQFDAFESEGSLQKLDGMIADQLDLVREVHTVKVHTFSNGDQMERCDQCRYGLGFLSDGISVYREPHTFNRHIHDWKGFTKRHQYAKGKVLVIVRLESKSDGPVTFAVPMPSTELSKAETQAVQKYIDARTTEERESALQALASVNRRQDVGTRRDGREMLVSPKAFDRAASNWSAYSAGILYKPTTPNSDHATKLQERADAQAGYTEDPSRYNPTVAAWDYVVETYPDLVCDRWKQYPLFFEDMGSKPVDRSLCRYRNAGRFEPGNVFWATKKQAAFERMGDR